MKHNKLPRRSVRTYSWFRTSIHDAVFTQNNPAKVLHILDKDRGSRQCFIRPCNGCHQQWTRELTAFKNLSQDIWKFSKSEFLFLKPECTRIGRKFVSSTGVVRGRQQISGKSKREVSDLIIWSTGYRNELSASWTVYLENIFCKFTENWICIVMAL